ncbi:DUF1638 domain-containing protein [Sneathiella sp. CAU 1612]|uniref:DUF1638 domain-containing protein n=1 Tax=Sneathiella sedimenti TaxID=2816034 RepID=A0ABS3F5E5_9PROT|nr:DUF1638 domain-containing protein [Sneathiella sedimenti]MBO0333706.1 DUF1638 domain-containing protein [Sneathiella sedimenti]
MTTAPGKTLLIACGALAEECFAVIRANGWDHMEVTCLPAKLHNRPALIPEAMRKKIHENRDRFDQILALYGDCGTGGGLDKVLNEEGVERIAGAHCYEFYTGAAAFAAIADAEPATFYLTDFLARYFDRLIIEGLGIDKHPELLPLYFGNYEKLLYLSQIDNAELQDKARAAAEQLSLDYEYRFTGLSGLGDFLNQKAG